MIIQQNELKMKLLSSLDEMLLLVIQSLGKNAYGISIRNKLKDVTGQNWSIGSIYYPLYRLEEKEYVKSIVAEPTAERGGRSKRLFFITELGENALTQHQKLRDELSDSNEGIVYSG